MNLIKKQISDGINLNYLETDKFKTGFLSINFVAPLEKSSISKNAIIPSVLMRGSKSYPNMAEINKKLDYLYASSITGTNAKKGDKQIFGLYANMLNSQYTINGENLLNDVLDVIGDILLNPIVSNGAFDNAYTESEKANQIDTIKSNINNKIYYARSRCISEMCKNEPYGLDVNGTIEDIKDCTPASLYEQYKYALEAYPIEIFFVGMCDVKNLAEKLTKMFGGVKRHTVTIPETTIVRTAKEVKKIMEDMPVNQGKLNLGFRASAGLKDKEYPALMMLNSIFGGGTTSKLFMNVREKLSLCYYCSSSPDAAKGLIIVSAGIEVKNRDIAEKAILEQLEAIKAGDFSEEDFTSARLGLINSYEELSDRAAGLENWYIGRLLEKVDETPETTVKKIEAVSKQDVIALANKITLDTVYFLNGTLKGDDQNA